MYSSNRDGNVLGDVLWVSSGIQGEIPTADAIQAIVVLWC